MVTLIDATLLDQLCADAAAAPRRRKNFNFHPHADAPAHRLLNALQPDTYIRPHRHLAADKDETYIVVRGRLGLIVFDAAGGVTTTQTLGATGTVLGVDIPYGTWHSAVALAPDTVFFEAKAGPYLSLTAEEIAPWAPAEGTAEAAAYLARLTALFGATQT